MDTVFQGAAEAQGMEEAGGFMLGTRLIYSFLTMKSHLQYLLNPSILFIHFPRGGHHCLHGEAVTRLPASSLTQQFSTWLYIRII